MESGERDPWLQSLCIAELKPPVTVIKLTSWNQASPRFLRSPTLEWKRVPRAAKYVVEISPRHSEPKHTLHTREPRADFSFCWGKLPLDKIRWMVTALDARGRFLDTTHIHSFAKADARFRPRKRHADWRDSGERNVRFLFNAKPPKLTLAPGETVPRWAVASNYDPKLPVYAWHCCYMSGKFLKEVQFPAGHYPFFIELFLEYAAHGRDARMRREAMRQAILFGRLLKKFSWPASYQCAFMPCSSIGLGKFGASTEGRNYTIIRSALSAVALLDLAKATGTAAFRDHAVHIATTLLKFQRRDGSMPMRVDPKSGKATAGFCTGAIIVATLFDAIEEVVSGKDRVKFSRGRERAIAWMLDNPVRTNQWDGSFEDVEAKNAFANLSNIEALQTIRYLCRHAHEDSSHARTAGRIHEWVEDQFVVYGQDDSLHNNPPLPSVFEQFACPHPMEPHTANWLDTLIPLYQVTGRKGYWDRALAAADAITEFQAEDGRYHTMAPDRILKAPPHDENWFGANAWASWALLRFARLHKKLARPDPSNVSLIPRY